MFWNLFGSILLPVPKAAGGALEASCEFRPELVPSPDTEDRKL